MASVWVLGHSEPRRLQETLQRKIRDCCMSSDVDMEVSSSPTSPIYAPVLPASNPLQPTGRR